MILDFDMENRQIEPLESAFSTQLLKFLSPYVCPPTMLLLSQCQISMSFSRRKLLIGCPDHKTAIGLCNLRSRRRDLIRAALSCGLVDIHWIGIYLPDREFLIFRI